jgi:hypothetical protein
VVAILLPNYNHASCYHGKSESAYRVTVAVKPTVSGNTASATVSQKTVDNAIAKAQAEANKNGTKQKWHCGGN